ncbi:uncharacterized protein KGF55_004834 [Candida pseudojiufengensis]|uniref:uncharacterized protein n=1 Tax=Candida pseudojiufengensis TaxID=497109 RepID=UPI0022241C6C|nr:uncharacterized protein KGF55_004834 [Candida pseudojiufengensis]KAI5960111.1 hypothetical protein KGF55_004834 [Candida pseudojiufengensis]
MDMFFISILLFLNYTFSSPINVDIRSINPKRDSTSWDPELAFQITINATWSLFWNNQYQAFNAYDPQCQSGFNYDSVWNVAVAGKAIVNSGDTTKTQLVINNLYKFQNQQTGWFTSTPGGSQAYTDDNSQVLWVFLDAYKLTSNQQYLTTAINLIHLIQTQWSTIGGITWEVGANYIASISTTEAALSAVRVYEYNNDKTLLTFANSCLSWLDTHLTDTDGFYFDGIDSRDWSINRGKLTYTVGTAISTYSYLTKFTGDGLYLNKAIKLANSVFESTVFLNSNGVWNNNLSYSHLLFVGIADLITLLQQTQYVNQLTSQANFIWLYDQLTPGSFGDYQNIQVLYNRYQSITNDKALGFNSIIDNYCNGNFQQPKRTLLNDGSAAQIFYQITRIN